MSDMQLQLNLVSASKDEMYKTPQGSDDNSPNANNNSESIEVLATPSNTYSSGLLQESVTSVSSNNTDIWVLENHYDYYVKDQFTDAIGEDYIKDDNEYLYDDLDSDEEFVRSIGLRENLGKFTVVHKSQKRSILCKAKKPMQNTENCNLHCDYIKQGPAYSGTDSDVEVLVEEVEIVEPSWSASDLPWPAMLTKNESSDGNINTGCKGESQACEISSNVCRRSGHSKVCLDIQYTEEQRQNECLTHNTYENLDRAQLLEVIKEQELHIKSLEANLKKYQKAQQKMCEHVNALRLELREMSVSPTIIPKH